MSKFAFFVLPEPGHILPSLRVASCMQARGHSVKYLCPPYLQSFFRHHGFQSQTILERLFATDAVDLFSAPQGRIVFETLFAYRKQTGGEPAEILAAEIAQMDFDILVCDGVIAADCGQLLLQKIGRPIVSLWLWVPSPDTSIAGLPEVVLCPEEFCLPTEHRIGTSPMEERLYAEPSVFRDRTRKNTPTDLHVSQPLVYCSFGTQTKRYNSYSAILKSIIQAFERIPVQLVIAGDLGADNISHLPPLPPNVMATMRADPRQLEWISCASLCITHGGLGTLKECILSAVPVLVIPLDLDQPANAARVEHHCLGHSCLPEHCSPQRIRHLIRDLLENREIVFSVKRMSTIFNRYEVQTPAVEFLIQQANKA